MHPPIDTHACVARLVQLYEQLTPAQLPLLEGYYALDARFKDPFNDVHGVPAIRAIFAHMFESLEQPRFIVTQRLVQDDRAFLQWEFHFRLKRWRAQVPQCIHGATLVHFDAQGRVTLHRDYWDPAEELYEKLPVLGALMRWLRKAGAAPLPHPHRCSPPSDR